jgi:hypothetical protein
MTILRASRAVVSTREVFAVLQTFGEPMWRCRIIGSRTCVTVRPQHYRARTLPEHQV